MWLQQPRVTLWVLDTDYIYAMRVSIKHLGVYWHRHCEYDIPFCKRYTETVESFLLRYPELRNKIYTTINSKEHYYNGMEGVVNLHPESYKYDKCT